MDKREMERALKRAVKRKPSIAAYARSVGATPQRVNYWLRYMKKVPAQFVLATERETGVSRYDLRPDIYPQEA